MTSLPTSVCWGGQNAVNPHQHTLQYAVEVTKYSVLQKGTGEAKQKRLDKPLVSCGRRDLELRFHIKGNQKRKMKNLPPRKGS